MSIYADNWIIDEITGEKKLVKHLNKKRVDRGRWNKTSGAWNKNGKKARINKSKSFPEKSYYDKLNSPEQLELRKNKWLNKEYPEKEQILQDIEKIKNKLCRTNDTM